MAGEPYQNRPLSSVTNSRIVFSACGIGNSVTSPVLGSSRPITSIHSEEYQTVDFANGGDIRGMIAANEAFLKLINDDTKVVIGHGPLAKKSDVQEFHDMLVTARARVEKLFNEGKSEAEVVAMRPLADLDAKWAVNDSNAVAFTRMVYNSFKRS